MKTLGCILFILLLYPCSAFPFEKEVQQAVRDQLAIYPESRLQDIYKNFFQDRFGPGHLISDTTGSGNYLRRELASYTQCTGPVTEPTGWEHHFYRVNLSVLKENKIPYAEFFDAFVESVNTIQMPSIAEWSEEWNSILTVINQMNLNLPDYEKDKAAIEELLLSGEYVMHHSDVFSEHYQPHYRIIRKDIFEQRLRKFLFP